jgi:AcrR family transcriptional regulator
MRARQKQATRARILSAARALFERAGFDQTTVKAIAEAASVSAGSVIAHFESKDALFNELLVEDYTRDAHAMGAASAFDGPALQRVIAAFDAAYALQLEKLDLLRVGFIVSWRRSEDLDRRNRAGLKPVFDVVMAILRDGAAAGEFEDGPHLQIAAEILFDAYLNSYRRAIFAGWDRARLTAHFASRAALVFHGFAPAPQRATRG